MADAADGTRLIPVSHLNAFAYCPRRFFLEHNRGMFEDNHHTREGRERHRRVDAGAPGRPAKEKDRVHRRSVVLSSASLGIVGRLDLLEERAEECYPVEYKKGKKPPKGKAPWRNDQVQLCAQGLLMAENGLPMPEKAFLYYIASRARVAVALDAELISETRRIIAGCARTARESEPPPLAENRNQCFGCSLNAICLPEEEIAVRQGKPNARAIIPKVPDGDLLYVDTPGTWINLSQGRLRATTPEGDVRAEMDLDRLSEVVLAGPAQMTTQVVHECLRRGIPVHYMTTGGRYLGLAAGMNHFHGLLREAQWRAHFDPDRCLDIARTIVRAKLINMRTLMMRYRREERSETDERDFQGLRDLRKASEAAPAVESLRGLEGSGARIYFQKFPDFVKAERRAEFPFAGRNRRPPRDRVNALLSFGYSLLTRDCVSAAQRVGFDPFCGFFHSMKYGRPALALDMMEFFRQPVVDSAVLSGINNGVFRSGDFHEFQGVCYLNERGRKKFLAQYELRKRDQVTHPRFHYRLSYSRTIELQYRLLGKVLLGEMEGLEGFYIR